MRAATPGCRPRGCGRRVALPQRASRGFRNLDPGYAYSIGSRIRHVVARAPVPARGRPLELVANDGRALRGPLATPMITWIGHSTFLVQLDGVSLLTDPIWSSRTSPVPFAGPRRRCTGAPSS
jgi:N-acyl-phosphatidylethanolamine-hydrolysing phospholipase D